MLTLLYKGHDYADGHKNRIHYKYKKKYVQRWL